MAVVVMSRAEDSMPQASLLPSDCYFLSNGAALQRRSVLLPEDVSFSIKIGYLPMSYCSRSLISLKDNKAYCYCHHTWLLTINAWQDSIVEDTIYHTLGFQT